MASRTDGPYAVPLSPMELKVVQTLVKTGAAGNRQLAGILGITEPTAKVHIRIAMNKVSALNRTQLVLWALRHGFASMPEVGLPAAPEVPRA